MEKKGNHTAAKASTASILYVAMVLFASHVAEALRRAIRRTRILSVRVGPVCCRLLCRWPS